MWRVSGKQWEDTDQKSENAHQSQYISDLFLKRVRILTDFKFHSPQCVRKSYGGNKDGILLKKHSREDDKKVISSKEQFQ